MSVDPTADEAANAALAEELLRFERLLQEGYASAGRLASKAIDAQAAHNLSIVSGHRVLSAISSAQGGIAAAINSSAEAHRMLETLGRAMGIDTTGFGDASKYPGPGADASHLRVAA